MKPFRWMILVSFLVLASCQVVPAVPVTIFSDGNTITLQSSERIPSALLAEAGITLGAEDRIFYLGSPTPSDIALPKADSYILTIRRAMDITLITPEGSHMLSSSASTVGQVLTEIGIPLSAADRVDPPIVTPLIPGLIITWQPAADFQVTVDGIKIPIRSSAVTVGQALAEAGLPLVGLDYSIPDARASLPSDGLIHIVRVIENISLVQKSLPYSSRLEPSADLELDQENILQPGESGLAVSRVRIRLEDGVEVSRQTESETIIRPAQDRVVSYGTRVDMHTTTVDGIAITYWRALPFYATSYSAFYAGNDITASGKHLETGLVGIDYHYIPYGTKMYVPGYGYAEAADTGAISGRWIDLGYQDDQYVPWHQWVTVYFLWPPPTVIPYTIPYPITWKGYSPPPP